MVPSVAWRTRYVRLTLPCHVCAAVTYLALSRRFLVVNEANPQPSNFSLLAPCSRSSALPWPTCRRARRRVHRHRLHALASPASHPACHETEQATSGLPTRQAQSTRTLQIMGSVRAGRGTCWSLHTATSSILRRALMMRQRTLRGASTSGVMSTQMTAMSNPQAAATCRAHRCSTRTPRARLRTPSRRSLR